MNDSRVCIACGKEYDLHDHNQYYCSEECESNDCFNPMWDELVEVAQLSHNREY